MKINFILGSALLLSQPLCAQNEEAKDTLTAQIMMQNLPEVFVKATRPIVKAERGQLVYNMPLLIHHSQHYTQRKYQLSFDNIYALMCEFHECVPANHQSNPCQSAYLVSNAHHLTHIP